VNEKPASNQVEWDHSNLEDQNNIGLAHARHEQDHRISNRMHKNGENCGFYVGVSVPSDNLIEANSCQRVSGLVQDKGYRDVEDHYNKDCTMKV